MFLFFLKQTRKIETLVLSSVNMIPIVITSTHTLNSNFLVNLFFQFLSFLVLTQLPLIEQMSTQSKFLYLPLNFSQPFNLLIFSEKNILLPQHDFNPPLYKHFFKKKLFLIFPTLNNLALLKTILIIGFKLIHSKFIFSKTIFSKPCLKNSN